MTPEIHPPEPTKIIPRLPFSDIMSIYSRFSGKWSRIPLLEYEVDGPITANQLRTCLDFPIEVALTENRGQLIASPIGDAYTTHFDPLNSYEALSARTLTSRLTAHTHNKADDGVVVDTLSFVDLAWAVRVSNQTSVFVIHENGITQFQKPTTRLDGTALDEELNFEDARNMYYEFQQEKGFTYMSFVTGEIGVDGQTALAREFAQRLGMVLTGANWDEPGIEALVRKINLQEEE